jgi:hypothetical protein
MNRGVSARLSTLDELACVVVPSLPEETPSEEQSCCTPELSQRRVRGGDLRRSQHGFGGGQRALLDVSGTKVHQRVHNASRIPHAVEEPLTFLEGLAGVCTSPARQEQAAQRQCRPGFVGGAATPVQIPDGPAEQALGCRVPPAAGEFTSPIEYGRDLIAAARRLDRLAGLRGGFSHGGLARPRESVGRARGGEAKQLPHDPGKRTRPAARPP